MVTLGGRRAERFDRWWNRLTQGNPGEWGWGLEEDTHWGLEGLLGRSPQSGSQDRRAWNLGVCRSFLQLQLQTTNTRRGFKRHTCPVSVSRSDGQVGSAGFSVQLLWTRFKMLALTGRRQSMGENLFQVHSSMPLDEFGSLWFRTEGQSPCWQSAGATLLPPVLAPEPAHVEPAAHQTLPSLGVSLTPLWGESL